MAVGAGVEQGVGAVQHDEIGAPALGDGAHGLADGLGAAGRGFGVEVLADGRAIRMGEAVALLGRQALAVFEPAQFLDRAQRDMAVGADGDASAEGLGREAPVAQVRLGGGAQANNRPAPREPIEFGLGDVRGVDQAPACIDREAFEQPLHRPLAGPGQAVVDLALLLGDVDVHGHVGRYTGQRRVDLRRSDRAQRVQGDARIGAGALFRRGRERVVERQERVDALDEAFLPGGRRLATEAGVAIQHRQQADADAGRLRRGEHALAQFTRAGVGLAVGLAVDVMELAHTGVAAAQHLDLRVARHGLELVRA